MENIELYSYHEQIKNQLFVKIMHGIQVRI